jgi:hypothetical protein
LSDSASISPLNTVSPVGMPKMPVPGVINGPGVPSGFISRMPP